MGFGGEAPPSSSAGAGAGAPPQSAAQEAPPPRVIAGREAPPPRVIAGWANITQILCGGASATATASSRSPWGIHAADRFIRAPHLMHPHPSMAAGSMYIAAKAEQRMAEMKKSMASSISAFEGSADEDGSQSDYESMNSPSSADEDGSKNVYKSDSSSVVTEDCNLPQSEKSHRDTFRDREIPKGFSATQYTSASSSKAISNADERKLKIERHKQSKRESAKRSRLRKQQECDGLTRRVDELRNENIALARELERLKEISEQLESENSSIREELVRDYGPGILKAPKSNRGDSSKNNEA